MQLFNRPIRFIVTSVCLMYFSLLVFVYGADYLNPKPGLIGTLLKTMEDDELYLRFFNRSAFGKLLFKALGPILGFSYGDFVYASFMLLVGTGAALAFYRLCLETMKTSDSEVPPKRRAQAFDGFSAALIGIAWVFLSRKVLIICQVSLPGLISSSAWVAGAISLVKPSGSYFSRFYQPGLSLFAVVLGVYALEYVRVNGSAAKLRFVLPTLLMVDLTLSMYPWIALTFLGYCGLQVLTGMRSKPLLKTALPAGLFLAGLILAQFGSSPKGDIALRLAVERTHSPYWQFIFPNLVLLGLAALLRHQRAGRVAFFLLLAELCASLSNVVTGYVIAPDHFFYAVTLPASLLLFAFVQWLLARETGPVYFDRALRIITVAAGGLVLIGLAQHLNWRHNYFAEITGTPGYVYWGVTLSAVAWAVVRGVGTWVRRREGVAAEALIPRLAWPLVVLLVVAGLAQQLVIFRRDYFLVTHKGYEQTVAAQKGCGREGQPKYFFTSRIPQYWGIPARSICENVLYSGWELQLKNEEIVARYMAAMLYFKVFKSREDLLQDLEVHLKNLASEVRQLARNPYFYSDSERFHYHLTWFLLFSGSDEEDRPKKIRELFHSTDLTEQLRQVEELDRTGQILVLETTRPDLDPPGRGM